MDSPAGRPAHVRTAVDKNGHLRIGGCNIDTRTFFKDFFLLFLKKTVWTCTGSPRRVISIPLPDYREIDEQYRTTNFAAIDNRK